MIKFFLILIPMLVSTAAFSYEARGHASWYGPGFHGRKTASGERFNQHALTAAHKTLPLHRPLASTGLARSKLPLSIDHDLGKDRTSSMIRLIGP